MSIVTKTGDKGKTSLLHAKRIPKTDPHLAVIGDLDELSAHLGLVPTAETQRIQNDLFELGALLAGLDTGKAQLQAHMKARFQANMKARLQRIEKELNDLEPTLSPLKNFILPGGDPLAAQLHLARAVCRRAERNLAGLKKQPTDALPYLNRLSDYLFLLARKQNQKSKIKEVLWDSSSQGRNMV